MQRRGSAVVGSRVRRRAKRWTNHHHHHDNDNDNDNECEPSAATHFSAGARWPDRQWRAERRRRQHPRWPDRQWRAERRRWQHPRWPDRQWRAERRRRLRPGSGLRRWWSGRGRRLRGRYLRRVAVIAGRRKSDRQRRYLAPFLTSNTRLRRPSVAVSIKPLAPFLIRNPGTGIARSTVISKRTRVDSP
jgi:hypothetical protein